jgi:hypothetical protein
VLECFVDIRAWECGLKEEADICVDVFLLEVEGHEEEVDVVDPNHLSLLLKLNQVLDELLVDFAVNPPQLVVFQSVSSLDLPFVSLSFTCAFEVVESRFDEAFYEETELIDDVFLYPHWNAFVLSQELSQFHLFIFILRVKCRPTQPFKVDDSFLSQSVNNRVKHTSRLHYFEVMLTHSLYLHWQSEAANYKRVIHRQSYLRIQ